MKKLISILAVLCSVTLLIVTTSASGQTSRSRLAQHPALIWQDPGDVSARDLRFGPGSAELMPIPPFKFIKEDKDGESPKFKVTDSRNVEWQVKLGVEAQTETVVTRIVWAVGYFAEEAYYFDRVQVEGMQRLSRGREYIRDNYVHGARFEPRRKGVERGDTWDWNDNPFVGTEMLDGLKVLMILLNNYDARTDNNRVLISHNHKRNRVETHFVVTDLGATLGKAGGLGGTRSKNDLDDFLSTRFVVAVKNGVVDFDYDTRPKGFGMLSVLYPPYYKGEVKKEKDMRGIPVEHARWIGALLAQLSDEQLRAAFRAARYDEDIIEGYVGALRQRIDQLARL
jgi:hypothetical protein